MLFYIPVTLLEEVSSVCLHVEVRGQLVGVISLMSLLRCGGPRTDLRLSGLGMDVFTCRAILPTLFLPAVLP